MNDQDTNQSIHPKIIKSTSKKNKEKFKIFISDYSKCLKPHISSLQSSLSENKFNKNYFKYFDERKKLTEENHNSINEIKKRLQITEKNLNSYFNNINQLKKTINRIQNHNSINISNQSKLLLLNQKTLIVNDITKGKNGQKTVSQKNLIKNPVKKIQHQNYQNYFQDYSDDSDDSLSIEKGSQIMGKLIKITNHINETFDQLNHRVKSIIGDKQYQYRRKNNLNSEFNRMYIPDNVKSGIFMRTIKKIK